jgi:hypothetical protein
MSTSVSVSATLDYNGTPIPVNSGDLASIQQNGLIFSLTQPVPLGTLSDFLSWIEAEFGIPTGSPGLLGDIHSLIQAIPTSPQFLAGIHTALNEFLIGEISITTLNINTKLSTYALGATMTMPGSPPSLPLFGGLSLDSIGVLISVGNTSP